MLDLNFSGCNLQGIKILRELVQRIPPGLEELSLDLSRKHPERRAPAFCCFVGTEFFGLEFLDSDDPRHPRTVVKRSPK